MKNRFHTWLLAALIFPVGGLLISPLDISIQKTREELRHGGNPITLELRELMGQGLAIAFLGGFRGVVADYLWIKMHAEWEEYHWDRIPPLLRAVTWLQPQCELFWDMGAWHLAYNIFAAQMQDIETPDPKLRRLKAEGWMRMGEEFLKDGIINIPDSATLYVSMARLYDDSWKFDEPCRAAEFWHASLDKKGRPAYAHRMVGHSLRRCAEKNCDSESFRAAFEWWRDLWLRTHDEPGELWGTIRRETAVSAFLADVSAEERQQYAQREAELQIPEGSRIFNRDETSFTDQEARERFNWWTNEWLRPHRGCPEMWRKIRAQLVALRPRVHLTAGEESQAAEVETYPSLNIPPEERIFFKLQTQ